MDEQTTVEDHAATGSASELRLALSLVGQTQGAATAPIELAQDAPLVVGRLSEGSGSRLAVRDVKLSRAHFRIGWDGRARGYRVEDLGARNGTYLNGRSAESATLAPGDVIRAGDSLFVCHVIEESGETERVHAQVARSGVPVLITGETGTGKERLARKLHAQSGREPLVPVNCGAIPRELFASELFGHVRGAFSGANTARAGLFSSAHGGTLFLDELCELPLELQPALLRVLDDGRVRPIGAERETPVDVRIIAATNADPLRAARDGLFRSDLHARVAGYALHLQPLRRLRHRIPEIASEIASETGGSRSFGADALEALLLWDWPYNVRELKSLLRALAGLVDASEQVTLTSIGAVRHDIAANFSERRGAGRGPAKSAALGELAELNRLLAEHRGNISAVAKRTGRSRAAVYRWMRRLGL